MDRRDVLAEANEEMLFCDGFDEALIGVVERFGQNPLALYDRDKCIDILMKQGIKDRDEAEEYFCFNTIGAWVGENTPCFATLLKKDGTLFDDSEGGSDGTSGEGVESRGDEGSVATGGAQQGEEKRD